MCPRAASWCRKSRRSFRFRISRDRSCGSTRRRRSRRWAWPWMPQDVRRRSSLGSLAISVPPTAARLSHPHRRHPVTNPMVNPAGLIARRQGARRIVAALGVAAIAAALAITAGAKGFLDVRARDQCDPVTFGTGCSGSNTGRVTLQEFIDAIPNGGHDAWKFNPGISGNHVDRGGRVQVRSDRGRRHTFTRVAQFGGGIVAPLNAAVGNAPTAPECNTAQTEANANLLVVQDSVQQFVAGSSPLFPRGTSRYQCCFHPWMRTTITVR